MKTQIIVGFLVFGLFCTLPTLGQLKDVQGWREAKWGMTENEILEVFKGEAKALDKILQYEGLYASIGITKYVFEGDDYDVFFQMDNTEKILKQVNITAIGNISVVRFKKLGQILTEKYGTPSDKDDSNVISKIVWNFPTTIIELKYRHVKSINFEHLNITYHPPNAKEKIIPYAE